MVFSDEVHFHLEGKTNKQFFGGDPAITHHGPVNKASIGKSGIYGPSFVEENINSIIYLKILEESFWASTVKEKLLENSIKFMQDGALPHFDLGVRS